MSEDKSHVAMSVAAGALAMFIVQRALAPAQAANPVTVAPSPPAAAPPPAIPAAAQEAEQKPKPSPASAATAPAPAPPAPAGLSERCVTVECGGMVVQEALFKVIDAHLCPGTGCSTDEFFRALANLVADLGPDNARLLLERDDMQAKIDACA